jgi:hypothetical protein
MMWWRSDMVTLLVAEGAGDRHFVARYPGYNADWLLHSLAL